MDTYGILAMLPPVLMPDRAYSDANGHAHATGLSLFLARFGGYGDRANMQKSIKSSRETLRLRRQLIALAVLIGATAGAISVLRLDGFVGARLVACLLAFAALAVTAWAGSGRVRDTLVVISSLVLGIAILEGASIAFGLRPKVAANDSGISHARPIVGWGPTRPGTFHVVKKDADGHPIYDTWVTIDDHLNRVTHPSGGSGAVAFFGDSFIFGDGVNDDGTLPQAFADLNRGKIPVLNLGFSGWSPAQNLAALETGLYGSLLEKPRHFVLFTSPFHLERTACKGPFAVSTAPRYRLNGDAVTREGECANWAMRTLAPIIRFGNGFAFFQRATAAVATPNKKDVETYIKLIETFVMTARQKYDVGTTVLFWRTDDETIPGTGFTEDAILNVLRMHGVDVLTYELPSKALDGIYRIAGDGHPTARANQFTAQLLQRHLQEATSVDRSTGDLR